MTHTARIGVGCLLLLGLGWSVGPAGAVESSYQVGPEIEYFKYKEPGVMDESGFMYGLFGAGTFVHEDVWVGRAFMSYVQADLDYDGALSDGTPLKMSTPNKVFNLRGTAGYKFPLITYEPMPFVGLGYRYLVDDMPGQGGYKRQQHYFYIPLGVEGRYEMGNAWVLLPKVEADWLIIGKNNSGGLVFTQKTGFGIRLSVEAMSPDFFIGSHNFTASVEPFFQYWNVDASDWQDGEISGVQGTYHEPDNSSYTAGLRASIVF
ncbi:MAG: hypothetical protein V2A34_06335 [Lentisphaerota bacterium]